MIKFLFFACGFVFHVMTLAQSTEIQNFYSARTLVPNISYSGNVDRQNSWKNHGELFDTFHGINAYANKSGGSGKFQCTELVHRFLNGVYGIPTKIGTGMGNANALLQREKNRFGNQTFFYKNLPVKMQLKANGISSEPPAPASVINFKIGGAGHTAVVRYVQYVDDKTVRIYLFEQHGFPSLRPGQKAPLSAILFKRSSNGTWLGETVRGTGKPLFWINFEIQ